MLGVSPKPPKTKSEVRLGNEDFNLNLKSVNYRKWDFKPLIQQ
ncbi:hypothetical protein FDUTEX481_06338 [Tolypothrix sp. PCC 7601]|nr:hypothetical protein FDUTEX481_06338 [Tolypothrix sp. PCC 7601]